MISMRLTLCLAALLPAAPSFAEQPADPLPPTRTEMRRACSADWRRFCATVQPGDGRLLQCFAAQSEQLSPDCRAILTRLQAQAGSSPPR